MMNQWWFKLYSINIIKKSLIFGAIACGIDLISGYTGKKEEMISSFFLFGPFVPMFVKAARPSVMRANIEFHKMHVPLKELRKAFYLDFLVCFLAASAISLLITGLSFLLGGSIAKDPQNIFASYTMIELTYFYLVCMLFCFYIFTIDTNVERRKSTYKLMVSSFIRRLFTFSLFGCAYMAIFSLSVYMTSDFIPSVYLCASALILSAVLHQRKALFNLASPAISYGSFFKNYAAACSVAVGLFSVFAYVGKDNFSDLSLSKRQRINSYEFSGVFAGALDQESFKMIEPQFMGIKSALYSNLEFDPSSLGVEFFLSERSHRRLEDFLYYGKPSPEFLTHLYDHMENDPFWKDKNISSMKYHAYLQWPKNQKLPERFLARREELEKVRAQYLAESKAKKAQKRETASEEE